MDAAGLQALERCLDGINPHAPRVSVCNGRVDPGLLYDFRVDAAPDHGAHRPETPDPANDGRHGHAELASRTLTFSRPLRRRHLVEALENMPPSVVRIKGVVDLAGAGPTLVQFVAGRFSLSSFRNRNVQERFLVAIGARLDPVVRTLTAAGAGDGPDARRGRVEHEAR